jgi:hypothetical protein
LTYLKAAMLSSRCCSLVCPTREVVQKVRPVEGEEKEEEEEEDANNHCGKVLKVLEQDCLDFLLEIPAAHLWDISRSVMPLDCASLA